MSCEDVRELGAELALDVADGEARDAALRHLAGCGACRRLVERLSAVGDELLLLAPPAEPPLGFETRVVAQALGDREPPRPRRLPRLGLRIAAPLAAAAVAVAAFLVAYDDELETAARYREALAVARGDYFTAAPLRDPAGYRAGVTFGYQGERSWALIEVAASRRTGIETAELVTTGGRTIPLPGFALGSDGVWGGAIPVDFHEVATIRLLGRKPGQVLTASRQRD